MIGVSCLLFLLRVLRFSQGVPIGHLFTVSVESLKYFHEIEKCQEEEEKEHLFIFRDIENETLPRPLRTWSLIHLLVKVDSNWTLHTETNMNSSVKIIPTSHTSLLNDNLIHLTEVGVSRHKVFEKTQMTEISSSRSGLHTARLSTSPKFHLGVSGGLNLVRLSHTAYPPVLKNHKNQVLPYVSTLTYISMPDLVPRSQGPGVWSWSSTRQSLTRRPVLTRQSRHKYRRGASSVKTDSRRRTG